MWEGRWPMWRRIVGRRPTPSTWGRTSGDLSGRSRPRRPKWPSLLPARSLPPPSRRASRRAWFPLLLRPPAPRLRCQTGSLKARSGKGRAASLGRSAPTGLRNCRARRARDDFLASIDYAKKNPDEAVKIILATDTTGAKTERDQKRVMGEIAKLLGPANGKLDPK